MGWMKTKNQVFTIPSYECKKLGFQIFLPSKRFRLAYSPIT